MPYSYLLTCDCSNLTPRVPTLGFSFLQELQYRDKWLDDLSTELGRSEDKNRDLALQAFDAVGSANSASTATTTTTTFTSTTPPTKPSLLETLLMERTRSTAARKETREVSTSLQEQVAALELSLRACQEALAHALVDPNIHPTPRFFAAPRDVFNV
jgi:hypothetical protein